MESRGFHKFLSASLSPCNLPEYSIHYLKSNRPALETQSPILRATLVSSWMLGAYSITIVLTKYPPCVRPSLPLGERTDKT
jgi:hypothetical protein